MNYFIDRRGNHVFAQAFPVAQDFQDGLALVSMQETVVEANVQRGAPPKMRPQWGFLDTKGEWAIYPGFERGYSFRDGLAAVNREGKWYCIDTTGQYLWSYPDIDQRTVHVECGFLGGLASLATAGDKAYLANSSGRQIWQTDIRAACESMKQKYVWLR